MEDKKYKLSGEAGLLVPVDDADKLIALGDGTSALLYLYALRFGGSFSPQKAAASLKCTQVEIKKAAELLRENGVFKTDDKSPPYSPSLSPSSPLPAEELPEYGAEYIAARARDSGEFEIIVRETQRIMGRILSSADLKILFGIYDHLGLPVEVIFLLINHCVEQARVRLGPGRLPTMHSVEKEAYAWHNREILTLEQAEEYLVKKNEQKQKLSEVKRLLQISGRNFSATERKYVESWLEMGFDLDALALAYDKTVVKTGGLQWKYMNSILTSWHGKNLHTAEEVERGDSRPLEKSAAVSSSHSSQPYAKNPGESEYDRMKKILDKVKKG